MTDIYDALERAANENSSPMYTPATTRPTEVMGIPDEVAALLFGLHNSLVRQMPEGSRILALLGPTEAAGASLLTCRLAQFVSLHFEKKVLYVNVNPARSSTDVFPELTRAGGLSEVVKAHAGIDQVVRAAGSHGLHVTSLSLGELDHMGPLLESEGLTRCLDELRQRYDMVLLDPPPASETAEGVALAPLIDGVVLVVHAEHTRWQVAAQLKDRISRQGGHTLGVVLNRRQYHIPESIYKRL